MSSFWLAYLFVTRRLRNQPFRKWDRLFYLFFFILAAILVQWSLRLFDIIDIHQRRTFFAIAIVPFLILGGAINVIFNYWPTTRGSR
jgi:hypothetical protein